MSAHVQVNLCSCSSNRVKNSQLQDHQRSLFTYQEDIDYQGKLVSRDTLTPEAIEHIL